MMLASAAVIVLTLPKQAKFSYDIERGKIWNQKELLSPYNFAILKTPQEMESDEKAALASITPIYQLNSNIAGLELEGYKNDFEIKWHELRQYRPKGKKAKYINAGYNLLQEIYYKRGISTER